MSGARKRKVVGEKLAKVLELLAAGVSSKEIGRRLELAYSTVDSIGKREGLLPRSRAQAAKALARVEAALPPPPAEAEPELDPEFATVAGSVSEEIERLNKQRARVLALATQAEKDGNHTTAGRLHAQAANLSNVLIRIRQKISEQSGGGIIFSREELEAARRNVRDKVTALLASPEVKEGCCPRCGERIRINWSEGKES